MIDLGSSGLSIDDSEGRSILYRTLHPLDDLAGITHMLHEAYAPLAAAGMRYLASHQDLARTQRRVNRGTTLVACDRNSIVGIITLATVGATQGSPFYDRPDVASFGQFAVRPTYQTHGIGSTLLRLVE